MIRREYGELRTAREEYNEIRTQTKKEKKIMTQAEHGRPNTQVKTGLKTATK